MSTGVQFEGDWRPPREGGKEKGLIGLAMRLGAKNKKQANIVLLVASVVFFIVAIIVAVI